jgi:hypothetical protein
MKTEVMYFPRELVVCRIKELGPSAWMLFTVVLERTYGKCRVSAEISIQEFLDETTLTEKQIQKALDKLFYSGILRVFVANHGTYKFSFEDDVREGILPAPMPTTMQV